MQNSRKLVRLIAFISIIFTLVVLISAMDGQAQETVSARKFEFGVFAQGGFPPNYKIYFTNETLTEKLQIYSAGIEVGMLTRRLIGPGLLKGQGEALMEVVPFWLARYPPQNQTFTISGGGTTITKTAYWSGEIIPGASVTPFLLRWNFDEHAHQKVVPWVQLGGGLLWTNHEFPLYLPLPARLTSLHRSVPESTSSLIQIAASIWASSSYTSQTPVLVTTILQFTTHSTSAEAIPGGSDFTGISKVNPSDTFCLDWA